MTEPMRCLCCGNYTSLISTTIGFRDFCSRKCVTNSDIVKGKIKNTINKKWGSDTIFESEFFKKKSKETLLKNWGVDNISKNENIKKKKEYSMISNFGVKFNSQREDIKKKISSNMSNYNKENNTSRHIIHWNSKLEKCGLTFVSKEIGSVIEILCPNDNHSFKIHKTTLNDRLANNTPICTICNPVDDLSSFKEKELFEFIQSICKYSVQSSYRDGLEIDVYIDELKIGFEFNGLYWHSEKYKDKFYHIDKTNYFKDRGIRIIHIWEDDWIYKKEIIKSQIKSLIGISDRVYARNCKIYVLNDIDQASTFLNNNHIQGFVSSVLKLGLFYGDDLVSIMTFDHFEGRKKMMQTEWNLNRFCNKKGVTVVGGFSKLLNYFLSNYSCSRLTSYADKSWSLGEVYKKNGFLIVKDSIPDYKYIVENVRVNKSRFRTIANSPEKDITYLKIWDCGKIKYELTNL